MSQSSTRCPVRLWWALVNASNASATHESTSSNREPSVRASRAPRGVATNGTKANLAYLPEGTERFNDYMRAVEWPQGYALLALAGRSGRYAPKHERTVTLLAGGANGIITGATAVLTIPMVPYSEALRLERDALVQLMAMVFCTSALSLALVLAETGRYDESLRNLSLWAVGPALAGVLAGERLRARLGSKRFRQALLVALGGVGGKLALFG